MRPILILALLALPVLADRIDDVFRVWDANGDGVLTAEEVPDAAIFQKVDADKNGKVTRDEIARFLGIDRPDAKKKDAGADARKKKAKATESKLRAPRTVKERVDDFFRRFDKNKDRKVQKAEFPTGDAIFRDYDRNRDGALSVREATRYITIQLRMDRQRPRPDNFFDLFDLNRDGKVTRREYKGGPRDFFRRYDHDRNGVVTRDELNMGPVQKRSTRTMRADKKFMADGPTQEPKRGLLDRYDKNGDGRLTLEELGGAESVLNRLDRNGDGVLSGAECK